MLIYKQKIAHSFLCFFFRIWADCKKEYVLVTIKTTSVHTSSRVDAEKYMQSFLFCGICRKFAVLWLSFCFKHPPRIKHFVSYCVCASRFRWSFDNWDQTCFGFVLPFLIQVSILLWISFLFLLLIVTEMCRWHPLIYLFFMYSYDLC